MSQISYTCIRYLPGAAIFRGNKEAHLVKVPDTVELYHPVLDRTVTVPAGSEAGLIADPPKGGGWEYADTKKKPAKGEEK